MTDKSISEVVSDFYEDINERLHFKTRVNAENLPPRINTIIGQLSSETMIRYLGSGIIVPENIKGARVLDVGCGAGSLVFILSKLVGPKGYVVGVDLCPGLIESCKKETAFHTKAWGYDKPNVEFHEANVSSLAKMGLDQFDMVVTNGVICLVEDKVQLFKDVYRLLKPGGQFYINDVYADKNTPEAVRNDTKLWSLGTTGSMVWDTLSPVTGREGFTTPHLTQAARVNIKNEDYKKQLDYTTYVCAGYRVFKLPDGAKRGAATVTYLGNIEDYEDCFPWDVTLTFEKGTAVNVDAQLATILASCYKNNFKVVDFNGSVTTHRNQNPFEYVASLESQGKGPADVYSVD